MGYRAVARVARNVRLADMNLDVPVADERRIEVVANGLPLWNGPQLARRGEAHPRCQAAAQPMLPGASVTALTVPRTRPRPAMPPSRPRHRDWHNWRQVQESSSCACWRGIAPPPSPRTCDLPRSPPGWRDGPASSQSPHNEPSLLPFSSCPRQPILATVRGQSCASSSRKHAEARFWLKLVQVGLAQGSKVKIMPHKGGQRHLREV